MPVLTLINGLLRVAETGGALVLSESAVSPCCCCAVAGLKLIYSTLGAADGHICNAANYTCLISSPGGLETEIGAVNLNNISDSGGPRTVELIITDAQASQITNGADDCCVIVARLRCDTPPTVDLGWGLGKCHSQLARLKVIAKDSLGNDITIFDGRAGENTISLNACPQPATTP